MTLSNNQIFINIIYLAALNQSYFTDTVISRLQLLLFSKLHMLGLSTLTFNVLVYALVCAVR